MTKVHIRNLMTGDLSPSHIPEHVAEEIKAKDGDIISAAQAVQAMALMMASGLREVGKTLKASFENDAARP